MTEAQVCRLAGLVMVALHQPHLLEQLADPETVAQVQAAIELMRRSCDAEPA